MNIKYGEKRFFIGALKFFDSNKDFGFIASNKCGMTDMNAYSQDFYINSESFIDNVITSEGTLVVFQIEQQKKGRLRAVNVRRITKSDEDVELAMTYYGEFEYVDLKNSKYNIYTKCYKPHARVAKHVIGLIEEQEVRSPESTFLLFKFFIEHYGTKNAIYVFDKDYETEDKQVWENFFDHLTSLEIIEILKTYPSVIKYITEQDIIQKWIDSLKESELSLPTIQTLNTYLSSLQPDDAATVKSIIKINARRIANEHEAECTSHGYSEYHFHDKLRLLQNLSGDDYADIAERFKTQRILGEFREKLRAFHNSSYNSTANLASAFNNLSTELQEQEVETVKQAVSERIDNEINKGAISSAFELIDKCEFLGSEYVSLITEKLLPVAIENLRKKLDCDVNNVNNVSQIEYAYNTLLRHYEIALFEEAVNETKEKLRQTTSIYVLDELYGQNMLTDEEVLLKAIDLINGFDFSGMSDFLRREDQSRRFQGNPTFKQSVTRKAIALISSFTISEPFDGTPAEEYPHSYYNNAEADNCHYLKNLCNFIGNRGHGIDVFNEYVASRTSQEKLLLYRYEVIKELDETVLQELINGITLADAYTSSERWYNPPALRDEFLKKVLTESEANLCNLVGNRLATIEVTEDNIPLIVFLLEIMTLNKPEDGSYYALRDWNNNLREGVRRIATAGGPKQKIILWAVFAMSGASSSELSQIFHLLPPYVQIKAVKKLFQNISQGRIQHNAESLYCLIGGEQYPICFPLEITFEYLKIRTADPNATLDNNIMLRLLDGRTDHSEWIGIRNLLHNCYGRIYVDSQRMEDDSWRDERYYNGFVTKQGNEIIVVVPRSMCDSHGRIQNYNNKYRQRIIDYIGINFSDGTYRQSQGNDAEIYRFTYSEETHIEILTLARSFNLKYDRYNNKIQFSCKTDDEQPFCEARNALAVDRSYGLPFYWCSSKPCMRTPVRFRVDEEWEQYTILDFMRILGIPVDYVTRTNRTTKFGHYIILNSYLLSFYKFYEHLKCRECGNLMKPLRRVTNFHTRAVNEFQCDDPNCPGHELIVYLNHCFNRKNCNATIDSRDSQQCPNEMYICPECGACCSTQNFANRISNLRYVGGHISQWLEDFVRNDLGHWEKGIRYCYKCGTQMQNGECPNCHTRYEQNNTR